jgi:hypothetical protein
MKKRSVAEVGARLARLVLIAVIALAAACIFPVVGKGATAGRGFAARAQAQVRVRGAAQKEAPVALRATGTFDVKVEAQGEADKGEGSTLGRYSLDKQYHGDLDGIAKGTMLTAGTDVKGSAGYVAMERVTGTLQGRSGSFVLQHSGTMAHGEAQQSITVVPDSGTGQLVGIAGKLTVIIAGGKHSYQFEYSLPAEQ